MAPPKSLINNNGSIRIRFTHNGTRFSLSKLGLVDDPVAVRYAQSIIDRISLDIRNKSFTCQSNAELIMLYAPSLISSATQVKQKPPAPTINVEVDLRKVAIQKLEGSNKDIERVVYAHLSRYSKKIVNAGDVELFLDWLKKTKEISNNSLDRYLDVLKTTHEVFKQVKVQVENKPNPKAFTRDEVATICKWFEDTRYSDYVQFLFLTGCRISEAIGLRWEHVDIPGQVICFHETLARANGYTSKRVVKTTKKNIIRYFPIGGKLLNLLLSIGPGVPESLVFLVNGNCINDKNFRNREWVRCLEACGIPYRKPSITRHTFISHYLEQTKDVVKCASLTHGSKRGAQTIFEHYASLINDIEVPDLY